MRWEIALEYLADAGVLDQRQLYAEADDNAEHQHADEELKGPQALHGAMRTVKDQDEHDVYDGYCTSCHEGQLWYQEVQGNRRTDDLETTRQQ